VVDASRLGLCAPFKNQVGKQAIYVTGLRQDVAGIWI